MTDLHKRKQENCKMQALATPHQKDVGQKCHKTEMERWDPEEGVNPWTLDAKGFMPALGAFLSETKKGPI